MKKLTVLTLSTLVSLNIISGQTMHAQEGWDPVKTAHIVGAADWCEKNAKQNKQAYQSISQGGSRILKQFITAGKITQSESDLVKGRVQAQGYYLGRLLSDTECINLTSLVANVQPWIIVKSSEERFIVEMPGQPKRKETSNEIQGQAFNWVEYESLVEPSVNPLLKKAEYYLVAYTDLPKNYVTGKSKDEIFDAFSQYIFQEMGLPELKNTQRAVAVDGVTARSSSGKGYGQSVTTVMYLLEDRFYLNLIVAQQSDHFERFLRSFEILDVTDKAAATTKN